MADTGRRLLVFLLVIVAVVIVIPFVFPGFAGSIVGELILLPFRLIGDFVEGLARAIFG